MGELPHCRAVTMELGLTVRCFCAGCFGFALGLLVLNFGRSSLAVQEPAANMVVVPQLTSQPHVKVFGGHGHPGAYPGYFPKVGAPSKSVASWGGGGSSSYRSAPAPPPPVDMGSLSPEQQAFMRRKSGQESFGGGGGGGDEYAGLSPEQADFMRRRAKDRR